MKDTEITSDWVDRYNDNELSENEKALFQNLMQNNPLLRTEVLIDAHLNRFFMDQDAMDLMEKVRSVTLRIEHGSRSMNYLTVAASVLCLIIFGAIGYLMHTKLVPLSGDLQHHFSQPPPPIRSLSRLFRVKSETSPEPLILSTNPANGRSRDGTWMP